MIDIPLSIVAWMSVVLIQAIVHYFILGARRDRIQQEEEDMMLEECLSLSTAEGSMDLSDECIYGESITLQDGFQGTIIPTIVGTPPLLGEKYSSSKIEEEKVFMRLLDQTGTDLFRRRSFERIVEEQVRARAQ